MAYSTRLQSMLFDYDRQAGGRPDQRSAAYLAVSDALDRSPSLLAQVTAAADSGQLTALNAKDGGKPADGAFYRYEGTRSDGLAYGAITLGPDYITHGNKTGTSLYAVEVMSHEMRHLLDAGAIQPQYAFLDTQSTPVPGGLPPDITDSLNQEVRLEVDDEARANFSAWNNLVDDRRQALGGRPLSLLHALGIEMTVHLAGQLLQARGQLVLGDLAVAVAVQGGEQLVRNGSRIRGAATAGLTGGDLAEGGFQICFGYVALVARIQPGEQGVRPGGEGIAYAADHDWLLEQ
jgi:hypothetical protein